METQEGETNREAAVRIVAEGISGKGTRNEMAMAAVGEAVDRVLRDAGLIVDGAPEAATRSLIATGVEKRKTLPFDEELATQGIVNRLAYAGFLVRDAAAGPVTETNDRVQDYASGRLGRAVRRYGNWDQPDFVTIIWDLGNGFSRTQTMSSKSVRFLE